MLRPADFLSGITLPSPSRQLRTLIKVVLLRKWLDVLFGDVFFTVGPYAGSILLPPGRPVNQSKYKSRTRKTIRDAHFKEKGGRTGPTKHFCEFEHHSGSVGGVTGRSHTMAGRGTTTYTRSAKKQLHDQPQRGKGGKRPAIMSTLISWFYAKQTKAKENKGKKNVQTHIRNQIKTAPYHHGRREFFFSLVAIGGLETHTSASGCRPAHSGFTTFGCGTGAGDPKRLASSSSFTSGIPTPQNVSMVTINGPGGFNSTSQRVRGFAPARGGGGGGNSRDAGRGTGRAFFF